LLVLADLMPSSGGITVAFGIGIAVSEVNHRSARLACLGDVTKTTTEEK
jgi:hypothetical protein